jgi:putative heme-binding domain-containing protein
VGNIFVADAETHIIHRAILVENGLQVTAQRAADEARTEFLVSNDRSFHPTQIITGPEGALYIADMQNGGDSGRIFRVVPETFKQTKPPQLGVSKTYDLVAMLAHRNGWHRDTAARLLFERSDRASAQLLTNMVNGSQVAQARLQALYALAGIGALNEGVLLRGLRDSDERVREHAVALTERVIDHGNISDNLWSRLAALSADPSLWVRYQLAFTLGEIGRRERVKPMAELLQRDVRNRWFQSAILSSLSHGAGDLLVTLAADPRWRNDPAGQNFLGELALMIGVEGQTDEVTQSLDFINHAQLDKPSAFTLLGGLGEGLHRIGSSLSLVDPQGQLAPFYEQSLEVALDMSASDSFRAAALRLRGFSPYATTASGDIVQLLFGTGQSEMVQSAAVSALGYYENPAIVGNLFVRWSEVSVAGRRQAINTLLRRTDRVGTVIAALEQRKISPNDLSSAQVDFLRAYREPVISQAAVRIFGPAAQAKPALLEQFKTATRLNPMAARGRSIFRQRCTSCHRLGGDGFAVGPELSAAKVKGKEKLLISILQPSLEITPLYATVVVETRHGENLVGIIADENQATITLRQPRAVEFVWPRSNIQAIHTQPWSLMPEGLEQGLTAQNMADLLEYLATETK